jgi:hypothetical protein
LLALTKRIRQLGAEQSFKRMLATPSMKIMHDDVEAYVRQLLK